MVSYGEINACTCGSFTMFGGSQHTTGDKCSIVTSSLLNVIQL